MNNTSLCLWKCKWFLTPYTYHGEFKWTVLRQFGFAYLSYSFGIETWRKPVYRGINGTAAGERGLSWLHTLKLWRCRQYIFLCTLMVYACVHYPPLFTLCILISVDVIYTSGREKKHDKRFLSKANWSLLKEPGWDGMMLTRKVKERLDWWVKIRKQHAKNLWLSLCSYFSLSLLSTEHVHQQTQWEYNSSWWHQANVCMYECRTSWKLQGVDFWILRIECLFLDVGYNIVPWGTKILKYTYCNVPSEVHIQYDLT